MNPDVTRTPLVRVVAYLAGSTKARRVRKAGGVRRGSMGSTMVPSA